MNYYLARFRLWRISQRIAIASWLAHKAQECLEKQLSEMYGDDNQRITWGVGLGVAAFVLPWLIA